MANESACGQASVQVPQAEGVIPGRRKSELTIRRYDNVGNEVIVAVKNTLGITRALLFASKLPNDNCLIWNKKKISGRQIIVSFAAVPREAVKIISGFSEEVAIAVTHPLWPSRDPMKRSDSDMMRA